MKKLDDMTNRELVEVIKGWLHKAPSYFRPQWTMKMDKLLKDKKRLTRGQRAGLINVIIGWNCDGRGKSKNRGYYEQDDFWPDHRQSA